MHPSVPGASHRWEPDISLGEWSADAHTMNDTTVSLLVAGNAEVDAPLIPPASATITLIGHVATGTEAIARVLIDLPDVLLLDTRIEHCDARAVCRRMREWAPATRVLAATPSDDELAYTTVVAGAIGAVLLGSGDDKIEAAIRAVAVGESVVLRRMASRLVHDVDAWAARAADPLHPPPTLTATEREVLARLAEGADPAEIAESHAVTTHLVNLHAGFAVAKLHRYVLGAERLAADR